LRPAPTVGIIIIIIIIIITSRLLPVLSRRGQLNGNKKEGLRTEQ
jgi:hypothetical protein